MRRLRGMGLAILILAGMSGCAGVQRHLSWPSSEVSQADESDNSRSAWWKRPTPDRSFAADPGPSTVQAPQNGTVVIGAESGRDIWSADRTDGLARYFPNTVRTWNRFTSRFRTDDTEHFDEVPVQTSKHAESERTALNNAARDQQVKTTRMTDGRRELNQASTGLKKAGIARLAGGSPVKDDAQAQSPDKDSATVFYEPTTVGRPRPLTYADLARDPAANEAVLEDDNIRPAAASRVDSNPSPVTLLVAMNDSPTEARTVGLTDTAIPDASLARNADGQNSSTPSTNSSPPSSALSNASVPSVSGTSTDGSATSAIRRKLNDIRTTATDRPADPSPTPSANRTDEPVARLASNADVPASAGTTAVASVTSVSAVTEASKPVAVSQQSPSPSPQAALAGEHNHVLFGWLCPFNKKAQSVTPSSQLPTLAYPTSYESCNAATNAKCESPAPSPQSEGCAEAHIPKKPCFLKTWLHTSAQASLEEPAVLPQTQLAITPPAPKKPCFLKTMFHHSDTPAATSSPQASPQGSVVATSAVKKPCFLKVWMHKFDHQPTTGCTCAGCSTGAAHCCCESQRSCHFKHFSVHATGQSAVPPAPMPANQSAANDRSLANGKTRLAEAGYRDRQSAANDSGRERTGLRGAEADDVAEKRQLQGSAALSASSDDLDKAPQG